MSSVFSPLPSSTTSIGRPARLPRLLALAATAGLAASVLAAKPAALTELSVTVKETYDSNVYGAEFNPTLAGLPEIAEVSSWVTVVSPKAVLNLRPFLGLGDNSAVTAFTLGYAADYAFYHSASSETNQRHNFSQQLKTKSGAVTFAPTEDTKLESMHSIRYCFSLPSKTGRCRGMKPSPYMPRTSSITL